MYPVSSHGLNRETDAAVYFYTTAEIERLEGTPFQKKVWQALLVIPKGKTMSYKELAEKIGKPKAIRAVANAVGANPLPVGIPCHRVIRSDGSLGGYSGKGGMKTKRALLSKEGVYFPTH
jgi:methylated-DNA-[protein]-cysteine S-methyltransferase